MADIAKDNFDKSARQRKVIFQQKKPLLNYELNLVQDIIKDASEEFTKISIGDNFSGESLKIIPGDLTNEIIIKKGTFYHEGVPVYLSSDKRMFIDSPPGAGFRNDVVYAVWRLEQVNSVVDPLIGFVTSYEQRVDLKIVYEQNTTYPTIVDPSEPDTNPGIRNEIVTFDSSTRTISLARGFFPDWLRISGTKFTTNSILNNPELFGLNSGQKTIYTVESSPDDKRIIIQENIVNEILNDVRFNLYKESLDLNKEFRAYRDNFIILAVLKRNEGAFNIPEADILDKRDAMANNFIVSGCYPKVVGPLDIQCSEGKFLVGADAEFFEPLNIPDRFTQAIDDSTTYIYISSTGTLENTNIEPTFFHLMVAEIQSKNGQIINFKDVRKFKPASWRNLYSGGGGGGEGLTGFSTIQHDFLTFENIDAYECIFINGSGRVGRSSAVSNVRLPIVGIATQNTLADEKNTFVTQGIISNSNWSWVAGEVIYASSNLGQLANSFNVSQFTTGQYVQRIGIALSSTEIFFNPELTYYRKDNTSELPLLALRSNGLIETIGEEDRLSPDRLSYLAPRTTALPSTFIEILPGRCILGENKVINFEGQTINLASGNYATSAIDPGFYNKLFLTLDEDGVLKKYEGIANPSLALVSEPFIPEGELPICVVGFRDNGAGLLGSILNIAKQDISDKRPWLNLGSTDNSSFKVIYRGPNKVLIEKGEMWVNSRYVKMTQNVELDVPSLNEEYFVYLNLNDTLGINLDVTANQNSFAILNIPSTQIDQRFFVPLAKFDVVAGSISLISFVSFKSKFWKFRDNPYNGEEEFNLTSPTDEFTITNFDFVDSDFLKVTINGIEVFENFDFTKNGAQNKIFFDYDVLEGASVRVRRL